MAEAKNYLGLDVGAARIGVSMADTGVRIAIPYGTITVDGLEIREIARLVIDNDVDTVVVGYPRNQSGEATQQTSYVEDFADKLRDIAPKIEFQDESLTSVEAENRLKARGEAYSKEDIDAEAAVIILQDFIEANV